MILDAKEEYFSRLRRKFSDPTEGINSYWSTLNRLVNKEKAMNIPPLLENGLFITNFQAKANPLINFYGEQCCNIEIGESLTKSLSWCDSTTENVEIDRQKVYKIIRSFDPSEAHGCDHTSIVMLKICDSTFVEPLETSLITY